MSRITGSEAKSLMEAYNSVYTPKGEITEEQIWEEVENWVNSLLEEGYDLSDYSWEEMYESYIVELNIGDVAKGALSTAGKVWNAPGQAVSKAVSSIPKPQLPKPGKIGGLNLATGVAGAPGAIAYGAAKGLQALGKSITGQKPAAAAKPASPAAAKPTASAASAAAKPTAAAASKPSAGAPKPAKSKVAPSASKPSGTPMQQWSANFPKLAAKVTPSGERAGTQIGTGQSKMEKQAAELRAMRERLSSTTKEEYDAYDLVLEYLLDNGHAETIDEAHYLMLEMDAEMVGDIIEGSVELSASARKRAEELGRKRRSTKEYKQGLNRRTGRNERAAYNLSNIQRTHAANPDTQVSRSKKPAHYDTGAHKGDYDRFNRSKPEKNPKHDANK